MSNFNSADPMPKGTTAKMPRITEDMREISSRRDYGRNQYAQQYNYANQYSRYAAQPYQPAPQSAWGGRICKKCHYPLDETDKSCKHCGVDVRPIYKRVWFWLLLVVFAVLLGAAAHFLIHGLFSNAASNSSEISAGLTARDQDAYSEQPYSDLLDGFTSSLTHSWADKLMENTPLGEVSFVNGVGMEGMTPVVYIDQSGMEAEGYTVDMLVKIANKALQEHAGEYGLEGLTDIVGTTLTVDNFVLQ